LSENLRYVSWEHGAKHEDVVAMLRKELSTLKLVGASDQALVFVHPSDCYYVTWLPSHLAVVCYEPFVPRGEAWLVSRADFRARWYKAFEGPT
jgi:hypothetical protein